MRKLILTNIGQIMLLGGICIALLTASLSNIIREVLFPRLPEEKARKRLRMIIYFEVLIAVAGIIVFCVGVFNEGFHIA